MNYYWCENEEGLVWSNTQGWVTPDDPKHPPVIVSEEAIGKGPHLNPVFGGQWKLIHAVDNP